MRYALCCGIRDISIIKINLRISYRCNMLFVSLNTIITPFLGPYLVRIYNTLACISNHQTITDWIFTEYVNFKHPCQLL